MDGRGLLILGASGAGKSRLALDMIGLGAGLVGDDRIDLSRRGDRIVLTSPETIRGQMEARGLGILRCPSVGPTPLHAVVDLDREEPHRIPKARKIDLLGLSFDLILTPPGGHSATALFLFLRYGRLA